MIDTITEDCFKSVIIKTVLFGSSFAIKRALSAIMKIRLSVQMTGILYLI